MECVCNAVVYVLILIAAYVGRIDSNRHQLRKFSLGLPAKEGMRSKRYALYQVWLCSEILSRNVLGKRPRVTMILH